MNQEIIFKKIQDELKAQDEQWGKDRQQTDGKWFVILGEEIGEMARAILEKDLENFQEEAIQSIAVIISWLKSQ